MQRNAEQIDSRTDTKYHSLDGVSWTFGPYPEAVQTQSHAVNDDVFRTARSDLPPGATAIICRPDRHPSAAAKVGACDWVLSFQPCSAQFIEPLMGWCGGADPLRHVTLRFPTREAAVRYAERHGVPYEVNEPPPKRRAAVPCPENASSLWSWWMQECLGNFDIGPHWRGNADADYRLITTPDQFAQNACTTANPAHPPTSHRMPKTTANTDERPEDRTVNAA